MNVLIPINYDGEQQPCQPEPYIPVWKSVEDFQYGLRQTHKDSWKMKIIQVYFRVRL